MIWNYNFWKADLQREIKELEKDINLSRRQTEKLNYQIERFLSSSFFLVRKLIQSHQFDDLRKFQINATRFNKIENATNPDPVKNHIDTLYNFKKPIETTLSVYNLSSIFIHSLVFEINYKKVSGNTEVSILINSDYSKKVLYQINLREVLKFMKVLGRSI